MFRHPAMDGAEWESYRLALQMFQDVYNGTEAFHVGSDAAVFQQEQRRLQRQAREKEQLQSDPMRKVYR